MSLMARLPIPMKLLALVCIIGFGVLWTFILIPSFVASEWFNSLNPVEQYVIFNVGTFFILTGFLGGILSLAVHQRLRLAPMLINGFIAFLLFSFVFDMWQPPMGLDQNGTTIITGDATLAGTSVDIMVAYVWNSVGITGSAVYWLTYAVTPIIAILFAIFIFGTTRVLKMFQAGV